MKFGGASANPGSRGRKSISASSSETVEIPDLPGNTGVQKRNRKPLETGLSFCLEARDAVPFGRRGFFLKPPGFFEQNADGKIARLRG